MNKESIKKFHKEENRRRNFDRVLAAIKAFPDLTTWRFPIYKFVGPDKSERRSEKNGS